MLEDYDLNALPKKMRPTMWALFNNREGVGQSEALFDEFEAGSFDELPLEWLLGTRNNSGKAKWGNGFWHLGTPMDLGGVTSGNRAESRGSSRKVVEGPNDAREPLEMIDADSGLRVVLEIPRAPKDEIEVTMSGRLLTISVRGYRRTLELPESATSEGAKATFRNGILEIFFPKDSEKGAGVRLRID